MAVVPQAHLVAEIVPDYFDDSVVIGERQFAGRLLGAIPCLDRL